MRRGPGKSPWRARVWREQGSMGTYAEMDPDVRPPEPVVGNQDTESSRQPPTPDDVPQGSIATVLDWVGDNRTRAGAALTFERSQPVPRVTLVAALEKLTA